MPEPLVYTVTVETQNAFHSTIFDDDKVKAIAKIVRSPAGLADVLRAFSEVESVDTEWSRLILAAKARHRLQNSDSNQARITDPILARVRADKSSLDKYEKQLLECVVDPSGFLRLFRSVSMAELSCFAATIETSFADVCVAPELIDTLRMAVSYPLLFPDAYSTGILAQESLGGVLLFGPPVSLAFLTAQLIKYPGHG
jgi:hypothetical protein